jgi:23S rRNA pseudouridine1911/1915/1917 synthase
MDPDGTPAGVVLEVSGAESGAELLDFVSGRLINESKTNLRRLVARGRITVNGRAAATSRAVWLGDRVALPAGIEPTPPPEQEVELDILFEDEDHLCICKPAGLPVLPGRKGEGAAFYRSIVAWLNRGAPAGGPYCRAHVVHRLDRETSGALLVAKSAAAGGSLGRQFERRHVAKSYFGIIEGVLPRRDLQLSIPLTRMSGSALKMRATERGGQPAETRLILSERFGHFSLVEARPRTGRQHQIRVHLAAIGYPLVVDRLYGRREALTGDEYNGILRRRRTRPERVVMDRCPLHAASIEYAHPRTGERMRHEAPLPEDMALLLDLLRRTDPVGRES